MLHLCENSKKKEKSKKKIRIDDRWKKWSCCFVKSWTRDISSLTKFICWTASFQAHSFHDLMSHKAEARVIYRNHCYYDHKKMRWQTAVAFSQISRLNGGSLPHRCVWMTERRYKFWKHNTKRLDPHWRQREGTSVSSSVARCDWVNNVKVYHWACQLSRHEH